MRFTLLEWKALMADLLDGVEQELGSPIARFVAFRARLNDSGIARKRKRFEHDLETFLNSKPFLKAASERYLRKKARPALEAANIALKKVDALLAQLKSNRSRSLPN